MSYEHLERTDEDTVTTVTLARPDSHNALNEALIEELTRFFEEISEDERVRVVVLAGEGSSFCAGADIGYMRETAAFSYEKNLEDARRLAMMSCTIDECPKPARRQGSGGCDGWRGRSRRSGRCGCGGFGDGGPPSRRKGWASRSATIGPFVVRKVVNRDSPGRCS